MLSRTPPCRGGGGDRDKKTGNERISHGTGARTRLENIPVAGTNRRREERIYGTANSRRADGGEGASLRRGESNSPVVERGDFETPGPATRRWCPGRGGTCSDRKGGVRCYSQQSKQQMSSRKPPCGWVGCGSERAHCPALYPLGSRYGPTLSTLYSIGSRYPRKKIGSTHLEEGGPGRAGPVAARRPVLVVEPPAGDDVVTQHRHVWRRARRLQLHPHARAVAKVHPVHVVPRDAARRADEKRLRAHRVRAGQVQSGVGGVQPELVAGVQPDRHHGARDGEGGGVVAGRVGVPAGGKGGKGGGDEERSDQKTIGGVGASDDLSWSIGRFSLDH
eukprot:762023-Prorocentrum_minimum.AAC.2